MGSQMNNIVKHSLYLLFWAVIVFGILLLFSCQTLKKYTFQDYMHIMVYDEDGNAVQGVKFTLDDKSIGESDVYGRFVLSFPADSNAKEHTLKGVKTGYRAIEEEVTYIKSNVLYFRTGTVSQYFEMAENALDENRYEDALEYVSMCEDIETADDILYLKALILKKLERKDEALALIKDVKIQNEKLIEEIKK